MFCPAISRPESAEVGKGLQSDDADSESDILDRPE